MKYSRFARAFACAGLLVAPLAAQDYRLSAPLQPGGRVADYRVAADGRHVVYLERLGPGPDQHVYLVDVRRPDEQKLLDPRPCSRFDVAADRLLFAHVESGVLAWASLVLGDGASPVELGPANTARLTPDGSMAVLQRSDGLFRAPTDGSSSAMRIRAGTTIRDVTISPDGRRVLFLTEGSIGGQSGYGHLFSAALDGSSAPRVLNTAAMPAAVGDFLVSSDSRWVVFRRILIGTQLGAGLCRVPLDGSAPAVQINAPLTLPAIMEIFTLYSSPRLTPQGTRVLYHLDQEVVGLEELYSAPLDGSTLPVKVSDADHRYVLTQRVSDDGSRVVFLASPSSIDQPFELYWAPAAGGAAPLKLNAPLSSNETVFTFAIAPDSRTVVYRTQDISAGTAEVFSVSMEGAPHPLRLSPPGQICRAVGPDEFQFPLRGSFVSYPAGPGVGVAPTELFVAQLQGLVPARRLHRPLAPGGSVLNVDPNRGAFTGLPWARLAANGSLALFIADQEEDERFELWAAPIVLARQSPESR